MTSLTCPGMLSVPKIVIKPRTPAAVASSSRTSNAATPTTEIVSAQEEDDVDQDGDDGQAMDVDQDHTSHTEDNPQTGDEDMPGANVAAGRPRGRPRGRGRGAPSGTSTPRARGRRGRGRGRGRGTSSLLIRLPKRGDDDADVDGDADVEGDADADEGTPLDGDVELVEKEAPMGGGKPFRKIHGEVYIIDGDEFVTEDSPIGDEKIDQFGNLLGGTLSLSHCEYRVKKVNLGRRFKAATFILPNRHPQRQYMLAIDAARTSGFRDSLYYFRRNLLALKLNVTQPEKDHLIAEGKLGSHLRTRSVTLITARSAFKLHGSKMIIGTFLALSKFCLKAVTFSSLDGKWVVDDYYEDKVLEEITARGLKAGDLVGELPDPNATHHSNELSALNATATATSNKNERGGGGGGGNYRAGGPTTLFGGIGWGPYSDGPLNAVRKSILSRDGVGEENWMYMMATKVSDASAEWAKLRKEAVKVVEGVDGLIMGGALMPPMDASASNKPAVEGIEDPKEKEGNVQDVVGQALVDGEKPLVKKSLKRKKIERPAVGVYDPHSHTIHCEIFSSLFLNYIINFSLCSSDRSDTQPTSARWEAVPDSITKRRVLGGTKSGNGAWALAWVDTIMELPGPDIVDPEAAVREQILRDVDKSGDVVIDMM